MDLAQYLQKQPRGTARTLAGQLRVSPVMVTQWLAGIKPVPPERCVAIERLTAGRVTCEKQRPDLRWVRVTDPDWTWHTEGRPLLDMTTAQDTRQAA
jgi:DNA-binding transcriptional regulator YdaS (Cro superfamily)